MDGLFCSDRQSVANSSLYNLYFIKKLIGYLYVNFIYIVQYNNVIMYILNNSLC